MDYKQIHLETLFENVPKELQEFHQCVCDSLGTKVTLSPMGEFHIGNPKTDFKSLSVFVSHEKGDVPVIGIFDATSGSRISIYNSGEYVSDMKNNTDPSAMLLIARVGMGMVLNYFCLPPEMRNSKRFINTYQSAISISDQLNPVDTSRTVVTILDKMQIAAFSMKKV